MPRLRTVETFPETCHPGGPWHRDPDVSAFLGASRGVHELYSDELPAAEQAARSSAVRLFPEDVTRPGGFGVTVFARAEDGWEHVRVTVPTGFGDLAPAVRVQVALDVVHATVQALGELRGWDRERLDGVRARVIARGLRFTWASGWKAGPGRRHQARAVYWIDDDGLAHVQLEIRRYGEEEAFTRSASAEAFMTAQGFRRSGATLHWHDRDRAGLVPWCGPFGDEEGDLQLDVAAVLVPPGTPPPLPPSAVSTLVTSQVITGDEWRDAPDAAWLRLEERGMGLPGEYGPELSRVARLLSRDAEWRTWWEHVPCRALLLRVWGDDLPDDVHVPRPGARKLGKDLLLRAQARTAELPPKTDVPALKVRARADLHGWLVALAATRGFPPPPASLPARVGMSARQWREATAGRASSPDPDL